MTIVWSRDVDGRNNKYNDVGPEMPSNCHGIVQSSAAALRHSGGEVSTRFFESNAETAAQSLEPESGHV